MQTRQYKIKFWQHVCFSCSVGRLLSIIHPFGPNTVCSSSEMYAAQVWHLFCFVFWHTGPRRARTPKKLSRHTLVMMGLQRDRVPEVNWKLVCLANLNITRCRNFGNIAFQFTVQSRQNSWSFIIGSRSSPVLRVWCQSLEFLCWWRSNRISLPTWM